MKESVKDIVYTIFSLSKALVPFPQSHPFATQTYMYTWSWSASISKLSSAMLGFNSLESWLCRWDHVSDFWCKFYLRYDLTIVPSPSHQLAFFILFFSWPGMSSSLLFGCCQISCSGEDSRCPTRKPSPVCWSWSQQCGRESSDPAFSRPGDIGSTEWIAKAASLSEETWDEASWGLAPWALLWEGSSCQLFRVAFSWGTSLRGAQRLTEMALGFVWLLLSSFEITFRTFTFCGYF